MEAELSFREIRPKREPNDDRFPFNVSHRNEAPKAAIVREVAVIAHHEKAIGWHGDRPAILAHEIILIEHDEMIVVIQMLGVNIDVVRVVFWIIESFENRIRSQGRNRIMRHLLLVDVKNLVSHFDRIAGNADDALDVVDVLALGIQENDDIASLGRSAFNQVNGMVRDKIGEGDFQAVGELIYEDMVPDEKRGDHGARGNFESFNDTGSNHEDDQQGEPQGNDVFDEPLFA